MAVTLLDPRIVPGTQIQSAAHVYTVTAIVGPDAVAVTCDPPGVVKQLYAFDIADFNGQFYTRHGLPRAIRRRDLAATAQKTLFA